MDQPPAGEDLLRSLDLMIKKNLSLSANCAQTAFWVLREQFGLEGDSIFKALTLYPVGVLSRGGTCGSVVGCLMALGLAYGREQMDDLEGLYDALPIVREYCRRFENELGGITCRQILKSDFRDVEPKDESFKAWKQRNISEMQRCEAVLRKSVHIAAEMLTTRAQSL